MGLRANVPGVFGGEPMSLRGESFAAPGVRFVFLTRRRWVDASSWHSPQTSDVVLAFGLFLAWYMTHHLARFEQQTCYKHANYLKCSHDVIAMSEAIMVDMDVDRPHGFTAAIRHSALNRS